MDKIRLYIMDSFNELAHHVTWPNWSSLLHSTRTVIIASLIISLLIMVMDFIANGIMSNIYSITL